MLMLTEILLWVAIAIALYQLFVTARIVAAAEYSRSQKMVQLLFVWLVPLVGALTCQIFLSSDRQRHQPRDTKFTGDGGVNPPGIGSDGGSH